MSKLTPGVRFIGALLATVLGHLLAAYGALYLIQTFAGSSAPFALNALAAISLCSLGLALRILNKFWRHRRDAARLGAKLIPQEKGKWPANIDVTFAIAKAIDEDYVGVPFRRLNEKHGNIFKLRFMWMDHIFTTEPEHIKRILATEFNNFVKGSRFIDSSYSVLGVGVFNSDGDMWKFHRAMTRPFFSRERISDFDIFARHADDLLSQIKSRVKEGYAIDVQDAVARFTLDSATAFLFGRCVHALGTGLPYPHNAPLMTGQGRNSHGSVAEKFGKAFAEAQQAISKRSSFGTLWALGEVTKDSTEEPMQVVRAFIEPILADALAKQKEEISMSPVDKEKGDVITEEETLLHYLVKHTQDPVILRDEILNMLVAGRDTTASLLTFTTYILSLHPDILRRLRAEILERVGPMNRPTYDHIREMKYLRAVINETLRLYPAVPFDIRRSIEATTFPDPVGGKPWYIPPDTDCSYSVFLMHRRTDLWGPDAEEFDPDRFLDERLNKYLTPNPFIFLPFNAGPRICLGQQFAYNEASFMLVRLLQAFDGLELAPDVQPPDSLPPPEWKQAPGRQAQERFFPKTHLTMYAHKGLWMRLREAKSE